MHDSRPVPGLVAPPARASRRAAAAVVACLLVVGLLGRAVATSHSWLLRLDRAVSDALYVGDARPGALETVLQVLTAPGLSAVRALVLLPVLVWLARRRAWWTAAWVVLAAGLVAPLTALAKELVDRQRPQYAGGGATWDSLSHPSGHSSGVAALVVVALVLAWPRLAPTARRRWLAGGVALALLVGGTRVWLGVHYLSDVVGGWALGVGWTLLVALLLGALPGGRAALPARDAAA